MRTIWPSRASLKNNYLERPDNISPDLPFTALPESLAGIRERLKKVEQKIDRIKISVAHVYWSHVYKGFNKHLRSLSVRKFNGGKGKAWTFLNENGDKVQFVKRQNPENRKIKWFSILLLQPSLATQYRIRELLNDAIQYSSFDSPSFSLSEIEFALDFYPIEKNDLLMLRNYLVDRVVLKSSHGDSVAWHKHTLYQGRNGNVRTGSKGLRCYLNPKKGPPEFFRIELQLNRRFIVEKMIKDALPIHSNLINVLDYVDFREGLKASRLEKLTDSICNTYRSPAKRSPRSMAHKVIKRSVRSMILNGIGEHRLYPFVFDNPERAIVAEQIVSFKKWRNRYGLKLRTPNFFPLTS